MDSDQMSPEHLKNLQKFSDPKYTACGKPRASVSLKTLDTLWFNTGSLCNLTCNNCYMESSPRNNRLTYITKNDVLTYLEEIAAENIKINEIGFTGGEPFMNPHLIDILQETLSRGFKTLILTNGMKPLWKVRSDLLVLRKRWGNLLHIRVSLDHYQRVQHEKERGPQSWKPALNGIKWLSKNGFNLYLAGRTFTAETDKELRKGYALLVKKLKLDIDSENPIELLLFPEMDESADVPEITTTCWDLLGIRPENLMCATSRMIIKRKNATTPTVVPCTLLPYEERFDLGTTLREAWTSVALNHPHCSKFCVLGGGSCNQNKETPLKAGCPA